MPIPLLAGLGTAIGAGARAVGAKVSGAVGSSVGRSAAPASRSMSGTSNVSSVMSTQFPVMRDSSFRDGMQDGSKAQNDSDAFRYVV
jgi:hypothetical protein